MNVQRENDGAKPSSRRDSVTHAAPCNSPAIFAANGDPRRAKVYRCSREAGHDGGHGASGFTWGPNYPVPEPERIAAADAGELREYDAGHAGPRVLS